MLAGLRVNRLTCIHTYKCTESWAGKPPLLCIKPRTEPRGQALTQPARKKCFDNRHTQNPSRLLLRTRPPVGKFWKRKKDRSSTENSKWLQETRLQTHSTTQSENSRHTQTLSVSLQKNDPQTGTECPRTSTRRCWPARRNERTSERTDERTAWTEPERRKQNTGATERNRERQTCGRLNKAMSTQVTHTQQSDETASDEWVKESSRPNPRQTTKSDERWRKQRKPEETQMMGWVEACKSESGGAGSQACVGGKGPATAGKTHGAGILILLDWRWRAPTQTEPNQTKPNGKEPKGKSKGKERKDKEGPAERRGEERRGEEKRREGSWLQVMGRLEVYIRNYTK